MIQLIDNESFMISILTTWNKKFLLEFIRSVRRIIVLKYKHGSMQFG